MPDPPEADPLDNWLWRAWWELDPGRQWIGGGMGPAQPLSISWDASAAWGRHHRLSRPELALLRECLAAMDDVYRGWCADKAKQGEK